MVWRNEGYGDRIGNRREEEFVRRRNGGVWVADVLRVYWRLRRFWWHRVFRVFLAAYLLFFFATVLGASYGLMLFALLLTMFRTPESRVILALPIGRESLGAMAWCEMVLGRTLLLAVAGLCSALWTSPPLFPAVDFPLNLAAIGALNGASCFAWACGRSSERSGALNWASSFVSLGVIALLCARPPIPWDRLDVLGGGSIAAGLLLGVAAFPLKRRLVIGPPGRVADTNKRRKKRAAPSTSPQPGNRGFLVHLYAMVVAYITGGAISHVLLLGLVVPSGSAFIGSTYPFLFAFSFLPLVIASTYVCRYCLPLRALRAMPISAMKTVSMLATLCVSAHFLLCLQVCFYAIAFQTTYLPVMCALFAVSFGASLVTMAAQMYYGTQKTVAALLAVCTSVFLVLRGHQLASDGPFVPSWQVVAVVGGLLVVAGMAALRFAVPRSTVGRGMGT